MSKKKTDPSDLPQGLMIVVGWEYSRYPNVGDRALLNGRTSVDMSDTSPDPPLTNEEMQRIAGAAKMECARILKIRHILHRASLENAKGDDYKQDVVDALTPGQIRFVRRHRRLDDYHRTPHKFEAGYGGMGPVFRACEEKLLCFDRLEGCGCGYVSELTPFGESIREILGEE